MEPFARLTQLRNAIASVTPAAPEVAELDGFLEKMKNRLYTVAVVGEFKRGKSSLINALLGMKVLPADVLPTTATINRVVYSTEPYARLRMKDGTTQDLSFSELKDRSTKLTEEGEKLAALVDEVEVGYPTVFCQNRVVILDTPGLNDNPDMDRLTFSRMGQVDVLIYTMSAAFNFSQTECAYLTRVLANRNIQHVLFTVGFLDQIPAEKRDYLVDYIRHRIREMTLEALEADTSLEEADREHSKQMIEEAQVLGISALQALDSFVTGNVDLLKESRIETYKRELMALLTAHHDEWILRDVAPYLNNEEETYRAATGRELDRMSGILDRAEEKIREIGSIPSVAYQALTELETRETLKFWEAAGGQHQCEAELQEIIRTKVSKAIDEAGGPSAVFVSMPAKGGLVGWAMKKAMQVGVVRDETTVEGKALKQGFEDAKEVAATAYLPEYRKAGEKLLACLDETARTWRKDFLDRGKELQDLLELEASLPEDRPEAEPDSPLAGPQEEQKILAMEPGAAYIGKPEGIPERMAKKIVRSMHSMLEFELDRRIQEIRSDCQQWLRSGTGDLAARAEAAVLMKRGELEGLRIRQESVQRIFRAGDGGTGAAPGETDAGNDRAGEQS